MKVLYVLNALGGGASAGIYESLSALRARGVAPYAVAPPSDEAALQRARRAFDDVRVFPIPWWNVQHDLDAARRFAQWIGRARRGMTHERAADQIVQAARAWQIDVIHSGTALTLAGAHAARRLHVPHIWHIKESIGNSNRVRFGMNDGEMVEFFSDQAAHIIAMSRYVAAVFRAHECQKITVIPDGVEPSVYQHGTSRTLRDRLNIGDGDVLIGMVAGLNSLWKQHDLFIAAARRAAQRDARLRFCIVGGKPTPRPFPYDSAARYADRVLADAAPLGDRFTLVEFVPNPPDIMRSLDMLVHPCAVEPFGRIAIEAGAAGLAVIGVRAGGIAETVIDGETGVLVEPNDTDALADAMVRLARDADERRHLGAAARAHIGAGYTIETYAERVMAVYERASA